MHEYLAPYPIKNTVRGISRHRIGPFVVSAPEGSPAIQVHWEYEPDQWRLIMSRGSSPRSKIQRLPLAPVPRSGRPEREFPMPNHKSRSDRRANRMGPDAHVRAYDIIQRRRLAYGGPFAWGSK